MQSQQSHSVHLLNIPRVVEECSVKSKVLPILQRHFLTCTFSASCQKDGPERYGFSDFVHLYSAVFNDWSSPEAFEQKYFKNLASSYQKKVATDCTCPCGDLKSIYSIRPTSYPNCHLNLSRLGGALSFKVLCNKAIFT